MTARISEEFMRYPRIAVNMVKNTYPEQILRRLSISGGKDQWESNSFLIFTDIVGYTDWCQDKNAYEVYEMLKRLFNSIESICHENCNRLETVGDAWIGVCSEPIPAMETCIRIIRQVPLLQTSLFDDFNIRIGLHHGSVLNVVDSRWQIYGNSMNIASRLESSCRPGCIHMMNDIFEKFYSNNIDFKNMSQLSIGHIKFDDYLLKGLGFKRTAMIRPYQRISFP
jgi:class 3 adenylate cyclase